eukprot:CAMPEP_0183303620 /NCGR_PEP_ID=MMETSP0160_2-20130417/8986_1 /TAXON_ID=2839 ORGANISM="Odontella Sinensis, Strain Grunow 1884" /NCGR_SAMPLE_ID=MMETSP0160_2 /ASSEMBLY_ACC=CAM_ASM_000250 /LENGTH=210 /DNA_ID=CAMNT_0025466545 /DNA_START=355 /DNA_END=987 /DNA_ORIENTATION=-
MKLTTIARLASFLVLYSTLCKLDFADKTFLRNRNLQEAQQNGTYQNITQHVQSNTTQEAQQNTTQEAQQNVHCTINDDCDNGIYCDGEEYCQGGMCYAGVLPCTEEDDGKHCTESQCLEDSRECIYVANDTKCDNGIFCDGQEICDPEIGLCLAGVPHDCDRWGCNEDSQACNPVDCSLIGAQGRYMCNHYRPMCMWNRKTDSCVPGFTN